MSDADRYRDCEFCKDVVGFGVEFRHQDGKLYHSDCLIQKLKNKVHELDVPVDLTKVRSAAREYSRIVNRTIREKANPNHYYGTLKNPAQGMYKGHICVTWKKALDIARRAVLAALKDLEKS